MATTRISFKDFPRLTRFYGIPPSELVRMPYALLWVYAEALKELQSEEILLGFLTSDMPHMDKKERTKARRSFERYAGVGDNAEKIDHNTASGRAAAAALGIKIDLPPPAIESPVESTDA